MVKNLVTAAHWNTANLNIYHLPWTTDKQNRFFSLEAWGPVDSNPQFTAKYLGRPVNIAFKSKHRATGKEEPCLCILFPVDFNNTAGIARLVQPSNFVIVNAFDGYDPIDDALVKKYKAKKDMAGGTWYKKIWSEYCTAVLPSEYKQPPPPGPVKIVTPPKKSPEEKDPHQRSLDSLFAKTGKKSADTFSDDGDDAAKVGDGDDAGNVTEEYDPTKAVDATERAMVGGKSPRHLSSLEEAENFYYARMARERQTDKNLKKEHKVNAKNKKLAKEQKPDWDSDNDELPEVSDASDFTEDTDFEDEYKALAFRKYHKWKMIQKNALRAQNPGGSVSSSQGKYELC